MKRSLIVIPLVLLVLLNACSGGTTIPQLSPAQWTAIVETQQVMGQTREERILNWLNKEPDSYSQMDLLEQTLRGEYRVLKVVFSPLSSTTDVFEVVVTNNCPLGPQCYNSDEMFMAVMRKMYPYRNEIIAEVPATVKEMWVVRNIEATVPLGVTADSARSVEWEYVKRFLGGYMDGKQFGIMVTPGAIP